MTFPTALRFSLLFLVLGLVAPVLGQGNFENRLLNDRADLLSAGEAQALEGKLNAYARETSTQIAVFTIETLDGQDLFDYAQRTAEGLGIGTRENDNGLLILVVEQDRKIRIHTGYGVEGYLPDVMANRIINGIMQPAFREGRYYDGLDRATDAIMELGRGEYEGEGAGGSNGDRPSGFPIIVFIIILVIVLSLFGGGGGNDDDDDGGYWRGGRYDMPHRRRRGPWIFPFPFPGGGGGGGFGGGFGGGGGGFGGFGGGGFGGGGASGGW